MKKIIFLLSAFCFLPIIGYAQNQTFVSSQNEILFSKFQYLTQIQLFDTAKFYHDKHSVDTALVCYSLIINSSMKHDDFEQQKRIIEAYNRSAAIYFYLCDYRTAYDYYINALLLCEKINYGSFILKLYNNLGNIYNFFKAYDAAKDYYLKALHICQDSFALASILNNLGVTEKNIGNIDSAFYFFDEALQISRDINVEELSFIYNNIATIYCEKIQYDSAFHYFRLSLNDARRNNNLEKEANTLGNLGETFFAINKVDSALYFIDLSNKIAEENKFLNILTDNYLALSKIAESQGNIKRAFEHYKIYASLKDSIMNIGIFNDINQLQRLYEVSKTNQQIEQLALEQKFNERTIRYQRIIQFIILSVLLLVSCGLVFIYLQKRNLGRAYNVLFEKNIEIIALQENTSSLYSEKYQKSSLTQATQHELLDKILNIMEDISIICDHEFTVNKLAELIQSNRFYVSQVINDVLKKNFRSLLNGYRIREAQRLFSEQDVLKYTIESVALQVGFKSRNAFREAFKEITGITPNFYLQSIQKKK
jgi:AraC-like DNA-binding protein